MRGRRSGRRLGLGKLSHHSSLLNREAVSGALFRDTVHLVGEMLFIGRDGRDCRPEQVLSLLTRRPFPIPYRSFHSVLI